MIFHDILLNQAKSVVFIAQKLQETCILCKKLACNSYTQTHKKQIKLNKITNKNRCLVFWVLTPFLYQQLSYTILHSRLWNHFGLPQKSASYAEIYKFMRIHHPHLKKRRIWSKQNVTESIVGKKEWEIKWNQWSSRNKQWGRRVSKLKYRNWGDCRKRKRGRRAFRWILKGSSMCLVRNLLLI